METNEKTKKNGIVKIVIGVTLIATILLLAGLAYARYVTSLNGNTQVAIAQWNFNVTAGSSQRLDIDLADTRLVNDTTEVDRTKVAPGTAGALQLNINATGTQVSLEYDIDLSLTQIPENLIFYSDSNMTNAIYKENRNIHLDGFFQAGTANKTETKILYWQWAMETGSTQAEIDINDLLDSAWMGDEIILGIQATGRQVMEENSTEEQYAVTFDANGGTLQGYGNASQTTKMVTYGENYGTLPTPSRPGYTFVGWNGKNKIYIYNQNVTTVNGVSASTNNGILYISGTNTNHSNAYGLKYFSSNQPKLEAGKTYTLSATDGIDGGVYMQLNYYDSSSVARAMCTLGLTSNSTQIKNTFRVPNDYEKNQVYFIGIYASATDLNGESKFQLEEGEQVTEYEPFYISTSTPVTQNKNHTLTAIWVEN